MATIWTKAGKIDLVNEGSKTSEYTFAGEPHFTDPEALRLLFGFPERTIPMSMPECLVSGGFYLASLGGLYQTNQLGEARLVASWDQVYEDLEDQRPEPVDVEALPASRKPARGEVWSNGTLHEGEILGVFDDWVVINPRQNPPTKPVTWHVDDFLHSWKLVPVALHGVVTHSHPNEGGHWKLVIDLPPGHQPFAALGHDVTVTVGEEH